MAKKKTEKKPLSPADQAMAIYLQITGVGKVQAIAWSKSLTDAQTKEIVACKKNEAVDLKKFKAIIDKIAKERADQKATVAGDGED